MAFPCPHCRGKSTVVQTITKCTEGGNGARVFGDHARRYRECRKCYRRFTTIETVHLVIEGEQGQAHSPNAQAPAHHNLSPAEWGALADEDDWDDYPG